MFRKMRLLSLAIFISFAELSFSFQVTPDRKGSLKEAIEKSTGKSVSTYTTTRTSSPLVILDDHSYSREIRHWNYGAPSQQKGAMAEKNEPLVRPLSKYVKSNFTPRRHVMPRKRFGKDDMPTEYWFDNRIHTFGNVGFGGGFHAACAPFATWLIDRKAYDRINARSMIARDLYKAVNKTNARVLDLCCGVGMSTRALADAFHDAEFVGGVDTSPEMISMARLIGRYNYALANIKNYRPNNDEMMSNFVKLAMEIKSTLSSKYFDSGITYVRGNAERVRAPSGQFDLVTIMYAFHEIPKTARYIILREARRLLKPGGILAVVDIHPTEYTPSPTMLAGEPYVIEYQSNIQKQMKVIRGFDDLKVEDVVPGHVTMWLRTRK